MNISKLKAMSQKELCIWSSNVNVKELKAILKENGFWICGTDAMGTIRSSEIDQSLSLAVIIGSEGFGMSKTLVKQSDYLITIPMVGHVNSLNASVSAGIVLHDLCLKK